MEQKADIYLVQESMIWSVIQASNKNSIVQIFAQIGQFDWCEPYRIAEQYEAFGSGFLIDDAGHIVTNAHVVEGAKYIWIQVPALGRRKLDVDIVGICPDRDLALLKISDDGLKILREVLGTIPFLPLGDSDVVKSADSVLVLGYPLGQYHIKSTTGIISGQEFILNSSFLQITAPINPGSSGGPVINVLGQVIGIAVAIAEGAQSVGYAIPINELLIILDDLQTKKFIRKVFLGVRFVSAGDEKARYLNNPIPAGLYIAQVFPGSVCDRAGIQAGDMLYQCNELPLDAYGETNVSWLPNRVSIYDIISRVKVGDTILMVIYRNGERKDINVVIDDVIPFGVRRKFPDYEEVSYDTIAGMVVMELTENHLPLLLLNAPELISFRQPEKRIKPAVVITNIVPGSYAYQVGSLAVGNIIVAVNGVPVATLDDWKKALEKSTQSGFVVVMAEHNVLTVLSLKKILADEEKLSAAFEYPLSESVKKLQQALQSNKR
jgi:serine protease Do